MFAGRDVPVHHPPAVHPRHRPRQLHRQRRSAHRPPAASPAQPGWCRRRRPARSTPGTAAHPPAARPPRHRAAAPGSPAHAAAAARASGPSGSLRMTVRPGKNSRRHPRAFALVQYLGPNGRIPIRQTPRLPHPDTSTHGRTHLLLNTHRAGTATILKAPHQASLMASAQVSGDFGTPR